MKIEPISVTELNSYIKDKIVNDEFLNSVYIRGEISNFKNHYTGHLYFTLKDENSLIKCIMFKSYTSNLTFIPKDGMKVLILGTVSVFERDGIYQIYCKAMQEDGIGDLYSKYIKLKEELEKEGLFEQSHKKKIPFMPKTVGILTSQTGSVIRDIINVSTRRNPNVYLRLLPIPVQGPEAKFKIVDSIRKMNEHKLADVIILARGGGSLEDLWPFNEEIVARAIFESEIPIISAVGHETDFTIADFVADLRAPTPSAAAELAVEDVGKIIEELEKYKNRIKSDLIKKIEITRLRYEKCINSKGFKNILSKIQENYLRIDSIVKKLEYGIKNKYNNSKNKFITSVSKLDNLSPLKILKRGYAIPQKDGNVIKSIKQLEKNDDIELILSDGRVEARIK